MRIFGWVMTFGSALVVASGVTMLIWFRADLRADALTLLVVGLTAGHTYWLVSDIRKMANK